MVEEGIAFAREWLKTDAIHARVGCLIARYPGHTGAGTGHDDSGLHIDNGRDHGNLLRRLCLETGRSTLESANPGLHT